MRRTLAVMAGVVLLSLALSTPGRAQVVYYTPVAPSPVVTTYYSPVVTNYAPVTTSYYAPVTSYYAPVTSYYSPVTTYYAPTTVYSAPVAVSTPGTVTTRYYRGFGIFRPRGFTAVNYYTPGTTTYYTPVFP